MSSSRFESKPLEDVEQQQLGNCNNNNNYDDDDDVASAEGRIVLRQTNDDKSTAELLHSRRRSRCLAAKTDDTKTSTTIVAATTAMASLHKSSGHNNNDLTCTLSSSSCTTSEVDSDDDAASIMSRLSQIVVEEEQRLSGNGQVASNWHFRSRSTNTKAPELKPPTPERPAAVSESNNLRLPHSILRSSNHRKQRSNPVVLEDEALPQDVSSASNRLPAIQVDPSGQQDEQSVSATQTTQQELKEETKPVVVSGDQVGATLRARAQSAVDLHKFAGDSAVVESTTAATTTQVAASFRRNGSAGCFAPERGTLQRQPERQSDLALATNQQPRQRSNTAGNATLKSHLLDNQCQFSAVGSNSQMLNFCRSTWTLSEFDQTFHKSSSADRLSSTLVVMNEQQQQQLVDCNHQSSSSNINLLTRCLPKGQMAASLPSLVTNSQSPTTPVNSVTNTNANSMRYLEKPQMRNARAFSVASLASSCGSFADIWKQRKSDNDDGAKSTTAHCLNTKRLKQHLPILEWLPNYSFSLFWGDLFAGLAVAVLNISTSMSAAVVAGTDFGVAFRASIINTLVYSLLCSSRHTSFGSWSIMSQMLLVSVRRALSDELVLARFNMGPTTTWAPEEYERWHLNIIIMYTFLIGLMQLLCGLLNLGNLVASFIPEALCSSLITATAFTMAVGQLAHMCGTSNKILFSIERNTTQLYLADLKKPPVTITDLFNGLFRWAQQITLLVKYCQLINLICLTISILTVILLCLNQYVIQKHLENYFKRKIFIPSEMILLVLMILVSKFFDLKQNYQVNTCGPIEINFDIPALPDLMLIRELWFESVATALISYTMVYVMAKSYSNKFNYEVDCNQELIACGAGNLVGGLFDALPATASFSRTAGQVDAGGQTQMASIINCIVLVVLAQLLGQHVAQLPICVMAATLFYGFARMMSRLPEVFTYWRVCKVDFAIWMVTFTAILTLDIVNGFVYGFIFSILTMLYRAQNRRCYLLGSIGNADVYVPLVKYPLAQEIEGISIFQFCGPIHYVSADLFERLLRHKTRVNVKQILLQMNMTQLDTTSTTKTPPNSLTNNTLPSYIILDFSMISYIDSAGIRVIKKIIEDYQRVNVSILLASLASHVAAVVKREPSLWEVHKDRFYVTIADAVHCALQDCRLRQQSSVDYSSIKVIAA